MGFIDEILGNKDNAWVIFLVLILLILGMDNC